MAQPTQQIVGYVFLALMVLFIILAVGTFQGTPTVILIIAAVIFLLVGLGLLAGPSSRSSSIDHRHPLALGYAVQRARD